MIGSVDLDDYSGKGLGVSHFEDRLRHPLGGAPREGHDPHLVAFRAAGLGKVPGFQHGNHRRCAVRDGIIEIEKSIVVEAKTELHFLMHEPVSERVKGADGNDVEYSAVV